jgi:hypothetical protein
MSEPRWVVIATVLALLADGCPATLHATTMSNTNNMLYSSETNNGGCDGVKLEPLVRLDLRVRPGQLKQQEQLVRPEQQGRLAPPAGPGSTSTEASL